MVTNPDIVVLVREPLHILVASLAVVLGVALQNLVVFIVLRLEKIWQHFLVAPAVIAHFCPIVIVSPVASHIYHVVDGAGASHHLHINKHYIMCSFSTKNYVIKTWYLLTYQLKYDAW